MLVFLYRLILIFFCVPFASNLLYHICLSNLQCDGDHDIIYFVFIFIK